MDHRDIVEIYQLLNLYGHAADAADEALLRQVFCDDGVVDCRPLGDGTVEGCRAIATWFQLGKPPHPPSHHTTNPVVYEKDGEVRVRSKWLVLNQFGGTGATGDYDDIVVRTAEGWRIKERRITPRFPLKPDLSRPLAAE